MRFCQDCCYFFCDLCDWCYAWEWMAAVAAATLFFARLGLPLSGLSLRFADDGYIVAL